MPTIGIKRSLEKIPGGMMIVPLGTGALVATFFPNTGSFFGSFTGALFTGALPILAVFYLCMGTTINVRALPQVLRQGGSLLAVKIALGVAAGLVMGHFIGIEPIHSGWLAGLSTLAVVAAINDTNGGLYMALTGQYGTSREAAAYSVMSLESGPFFTMITLGATGLSSFPGKLWQEPFCHWPLAFCSATLIRNCARSSAARRRCSFRSTPSRLAPLWISIMYGRQVR